MTALAIQFPDIDPVFFSVGPFPVRWYALAYITGFILGWLYLRSLVTKTHLWFADPDAPPVATKGQVDDLLTWTMIGTLAGGRLGHILFYALPLQPEYLLENPLRVFYVWEGGMSFHGGLIGVILALVWFSRSQKLNLLSIGDGAACAVPFGLFFGRVANFINAEILGKVTDAPWGVIFCNERIRAAYGGACPAGELPRHPANLYEAFLEGIVLFLVLFVLTRTFRGLRRPGLASGVFLVGYAAARIFVEVLFRDSNNKIGGGWTVGIVLSIPMALIGVLFIWNAYRERLGPVPFGGAVARVFMGAKPKDDAK